MKRLALLLFLAVACTRTHLTPEEEANARLTDFVAKHRSMRSWSAADKATAHRLVRAYTDLPRHDNREWAGRAYTMLWRLLKDDPKADRSELLMAIHGMQEYAEYPVPRYIEPARLLAERNIDLDYAELLGRRGVIESHRYFQRHPEWEVRPAFVASVVARAHESLAIVLQKRGRGAEAEQERLAAAAMSAQARRLRGAVSAR